MEVVPHQRRRSRKVLKHYEHCEQGLTYRTLVPRSLSQALIPLIIDTGLMTDLNRVEFWAIVPLSLCS